MAVCSEIQTKHLDTVCGYNVEFLSLNLLVCIVTTVIKGVITLGKFTFLNLAINFVMEISAEKSKTVAFQGKTVSIGKIFVTTNGYNKCRMLQLSVVK